MTTKQLWEANKDQTADLWIRSIRFTYGVLNALELDKKKPKSKAKTKEEIEHDKAFEEWQK